MNFTVGAGVRTEEQDVHPLPGNGVAAAPSMMASLVAAPGTKALTRIENVIAAVYASECATGSVFAGPVSALA